MEIDSTLFAGLDVAMSEQEQKYVTSLMTSGYPDDLCQAATILCGIADLLRDGKLVSHTTIASSSSSSTNHHHGVNTNIMNNHTATTTRAAAAVLSHGYSNVGVRTNRSSMNENETKRTKQMANFQRLKW